MFRIKENPDGSVSIFANDESRSFICSVDPRTSQRKSAQLNVTPTKEDNKQNNVNNKRVPTSPNTKYLVPNLSPRYSGKNTVSTRVRLPRKPKHECIDYDDASSVSSFSSVASSFSLASEISAESTEEPDDDCMDQWSFCRMLDLINTKRLQTASSDMKKELCRTFPIRKISCQTLWQDPQKLLPKRTDQVEICSVLGQNILRVHPRVPNHDSAESAVSKYERFCKSSVMNLQPFVWRSPMLRTREVRTKYPVYYKSKINGYTHRYVFSKKQRLDRVKQLRLGLSHRSFWLKLKCKNLSVRIQRLSQDTIDRHSMPGANCSSVLGIIQAPVMDTKVKVQNGILRNGLCKKILVVDLEPPVDCLTW